MSETQSSSIRLISLVDNVLLNVEEFVLSYSILFLALLLVGSVVSRWLFNFSWIFVQELCEATIIVVTFLGLGYCTRKARHIRMTALYDQFGTNIRKLLILIISAITSVVMIVMTYWSVKYTLKVYTIGNVTPILRFPIYLIFCFVPLGFLLAAIEYALTIYKNIREKGVFLSVEIPDTYEEETQIPANANQDSIRNV